MGRWPRRGVGSGWLWAPHPPCGHWLVMSAACVCGAGAGAREAGVSPVASWFLARLALTIFQPGRGSCWGHTLPPRRPGGLMARSPVLLVTSGVFPEVFGSFADPAAHGAQGRAVRVGMGRWPGPRTAVDTCPQQECAAGHGSGQCRGRREPRAAGGAAGPAGGVQAAGVGRGP